MKQQDCGWGATHDPHPHPGMDNTQCPGNPPVTVKKPKTTGDKPKTKCAKWCGRGCTHAEYEAARAAAHALAARLGPGWKANVWENMGWHYSAVSPRGFVKVHANIHRGRIDSYTAFIGEKNFPGGRFAEHGSTPEKAIAASRKVAEAEFAALGAWVKDAS